MRRQILTLLIAAALGVVLVVGVSAGSAVETPKVPTVKEFAQKILNSHAGRWLSPGARAALETAATGNMQFSQGNGSGANGNNVTVPYKTRRPPNGPKQSTFKNAIVNDPQEDTNPPYSVNQFDQTTQSETSIAVVGNNLVTGYNDSLQTLLFFTPGTDLSGYSFSTNHGQSWQDQGTIPNRPGEINIGDPWLASDAAGNFYYSTLFFNLDADRFSVDVGVAKSVDGGKTFSPPVQADTTLAAGDPFYSADKDALASGPGPANSQGQALYDGWDDFSFNENTFEFTNGLAVSHSYDGGQTWTATYADKQPLFGPGCSFRQYIGAYPYVDPRNGTVYVAAEKLFVDNPDCNFDPEPPLQREEDMFISHDGGQTFPERSVIGSATPAQPDGLFFLGPHRWMRDLEFPTVASTANGLYVAWNDGGTGERSHIKLAKSVDGGHTWVNYYTTPEDTNDEIQPQMVGDAKGLHIVYYVRNPDLTLDSYVQNSPTGDPGTFVPLRVSNQSFPGVLTIPNFDPIIAYGYMGDYIGITSDGVNQYMAWGDNRDRVVNFLYPNGRYDPDVFSAVQGPSAP